MGAVLVRAYQAGDSALHACARKGLVHVVRFLVDLGANIEATNKVRVASSFRSCTLGVVPHRCVTKCLVLCLHIALLGAQGGNTPLHVACLAKQEEMVHWLAQEAHANVEARNAVCARQLGVGMDGGTMVVSFVSLSRCYLGFGVCHLVWSVLLQDGDTPLLQAVAGGAHGLVSWLVDKTGAEVVVANNVRACGIPWLFDLLVSLVYVQHRLVVHHSTSPPAAEWMSLLLGSLSTVTWTQTLSTRCVTAALSACVMEV